MAWPPAGGVQRDGAFDVGRAHTPVVLIADWFAGCGSCGESPSTGLLTAPRALWAAVQYLMSGVQIIMDEGKTL